MISKFGLKRRTNGLSRNSFIVLFLVLSIICFSVGYAAIQTTLNINGDVGIKSAKWDVYFDNVTVDDYSKAEGNEVVISDDQKSIDFTINLNKFNKYFEFEVDAINNGSLDAMVGGEPVVEGLDESLLPYISIKITYSDFVKVESNHLLRAQTSERIKVVVEATDLKHLPSDCFLNLTLKLSYIQAKNNGIERPLPNYLFNLIKNNAISDDSSFDFSIMSSSTNGSGVYYRVENGTTIYYYRGNVYNNNVIYANHCWKILRTTDTGGMKIVYNGAVGDNNTCTNSQGEATQLQTAAFNEKKDDEKYVGYTYEEDGKQVDSTIKKVLDEWYENNIENDLKNYHYGKYLEDTVWCNDRSLSNFLLGNYKIIYGTMERLYNKKEPSLSCPLQDDMYTLKSAAKEYNSRLGGNELLDYPIGLLTADELTLAGLTYYGNLPSKYNTTFYLYTGLTSWTMSPYGCTTSNTANVFYIGAKSYLEGNTNGVSLLMGVRPVVSLKNNVIVSSDGTGSWKEPYVVDGLS